MSFYIKVIKWWIHSNGPYWIKGQVHPTLVMDRLVAKHVNTHIPPINKVFSRVEKSFTRHSRNTREKLSQKIPNKVFIKIQAFSCIIVLRFLLLKDRRKLKRLYNLSFILKIRSIWEEAQSPQINVFLKRRIERFSYKFGIPPKFCNRYYIINKITLFVTYLAFDFQI